MHVIAGDKPLLSELMKTTIDQHGADAARAKFKQIYPKHKEDYLIDTPAMNQLMSDYAQAGNMEALQVLSEVVTVITQDLIAKHMTGQEETMKALMAEQKKQADAKEHKSKTQPVEKTKQIVRTDLDRFTGLYGDPDKADPYRQLWVAQSCDGRLVIGATWGDVAPWWTTSQSDKQFSYKDSFIQLSFEFNETAQKQSTRLKHDLQGMASPLQRIGPLTDEYPTCFETPRR